MHVAHDLNKISKYRPNISAAQNLFINFRVATLNFSQARSRVIEGHLNENVLPVLPKTTSLKFHAVIVFALDFDHSV